MGQIIGLDIIKQSLWHLAIVNERLCCLICVMIEELRVMKLPHHLTSLGFGDDVVLGVSGGLLSLMEYI
jgi:hypothetical protein